MSDPFAPLGGGGVPGGRPSAKGGEWQCLPFAPDDAPPPPERHPKLGKPTGCWIYRDAAGRVIGLANRFDTPDGKQFRPLTCWRSIKGGKPVWRWEAWPAPRPLYGLDRLAAKPSAMVVICEGEKAADAAARLLPDAVTITSPNGSKSAEKAEWRPLAGRKVIIWPDADEAGAGYASTAVKALQAVAAASIAIVTIPDGKMGGWDAADAEVEGWTTAQAAAFLAGAKAVSAPTAATGGGDKKEKKRRPAQRDSLMSLTEFCDLWHGTDGEAFVTYPVGGHRESWAIRSQRFKRWLANQAYVETGLVPGAQAVEDTLRVLEARATEEGPEREPWLRAGARGDRLYIDLCDDGWRAVEITPETWRILDRHDCPFIRSPSMRPLPEPVAGDGIDALRGFANVATDDDFRLIVAWLLAALRSRGPYPILTLNGEQGTGKSTFSRLVRSLVDPNAAPIRAVPKDERDLIVAAYNSHVLCFDNLSKVEVWFADALCRLATGGGFSARALHTDRDEAIFFGTKPIILNGIPALTDRPDLADRAINVRLAPIPETERRPEADMLRAWDERAPAVFGALLDAMSAGLRRQDDVKLDGYPRLADFALWIAACEPGLGWEAGDFMAAYESNRRNVADGAFEADPIATAIYDLAKSSGPNGWRGTPSELLAELNLKVPEAIRRSRAWPTTAQGLGNRIDRVNPLLRARRILLERKHSGVRLITIVLLEE